MKELIEQERQNLLLFLDAQATFKQSLRANEYQVFDEDSLRLLLIRCKHRLIPASYGYQIQHVLMRAFSFCRPDDLDCGDAFAVESEKNVEIKVSIRPGGEINIKHIRPQGKMDYYLLIGYCIADDILVTALIPKDVVTAWSYTKAGKAVYGTKTANQTNHNIEREVCIKRGSELWDEMLTYARPLQDICDYLGSPLIVQPDMVAVDA